MKKIILRIVIYSIIVAALALLIVSLVVTDKNIEDNKVYIGCKGNLATIRSALNIYYSDNEGMYPRGNPMDVLVPDYIESRPVCKIPNHNNSCEFIVIGSMGNKKLEDIFKDSGKWLYVDDRNSAHWGEVYIDCTHIEKKGTRYCDY